MLSELLGLLVNGIYATATVETRFYYGAGPSYVAVTNLRFKTADDNDQDTANPLVVPSSGYNYSYWKQIGLYCTVAPDNGINNLKIYCDGSIGWTGCDVMIAQVTNYAQATGTQGTTGDEASANHPDAPTMTDIETYTSASPMSVTGSIGAATGKINDGYVLLQVRLDNTATAGTQAAETITWRYDET